MSANSDARKVIAWWVCIMLGMALVALLGACVHEPPVITLTKVDGTFVSRPTPIVKVGDWPSFAIALTTCDEDNQPVIILRDIPMSEMEMKVVLVHEGTHVRQLAGDCKRIRYEYTQNAEFRIRMELEAYCNDTRFALKNGADTATVKARVKNIMYELYKLENAQCALPP